MRTTAAMRTRLHALLPALVSFPLCMLACTRHEDAPASASVSGPASASTPKSAAGAGTPILVETAGLPSNYSLPLPTTLAGFATWVTHGTGGPPRDHVIQGILFGEPASLEKLRAAASAVSAAELPAWSARLHGLFRYEEIGADFCTAMRPVIEGAASPLRTTVAPPFARGCAGDADVELMLRADSPDAAVLELYQPSWNYERETRRPYHPRLAELARRAIRGGDENEARIVTGILAAQEDPRAHAVLLEIHAQLKDPERADAVAISLLRSGNPRARALAQRACRRRPDDGRCAQTEDSAATARPPGLTALIERKRARLRDAGFAKVDHVDPASLESDDTVDMLVLAKHAYEFDVETGSFPNEHDALLRTLAQLASPELAGVAFEERAPHMDDDTGPYTLVAYLDGRRYSVQAENLGDWYDLSTVLRLLNRLLAERGSDTRFMPIGSDGQVAAVAAAPRAVLARAAREKLILADDPASAERAGKGFEAEVLESLNDERR
jgi:hypothetical protein